MSEHTLDTPEEVAQRLLAVLSDTGAGLITDIDGTISPIAPTPARARVSPGSRRSLAVLAERMRLVAVISGRSAQDARAMLGLPGAVYVGNHGLEVLVGDHLSVLPAAEAWRKPVQATIEALRPTVESLEGVVVQEKGVTASLHYRLTSHPSRARRRLLDALSNLPPAQGLRITEGKKVIELRPPVNVDKGTALEQIVERWGLSAVTYLGDDLTDVDAFCRLRALREATGLVGLSVAAIGPETAAEVRASADYGVAGVAGIERVLELLAARL